MCNVMIPKINKARHETTRKHREAIRNMPGVKEEKARRKQLMREKTDKLLSIFNKLNVSALTEEEKRFMKDNGAMFIDMV